MEESGSEGLDEVVHREAKTFLKDVDAVCISCVFGGVFGFLADDKFCEYAQGQLLAWY